MELHPPPPPHTLDAHPALPQSLKQVCQSVPIAVDQAAVCEGPRFSAPSFRVSEFETTTVPPPQSDPDGAGGAVLPGLDVCTDFEYHR